MASNKNKFYFDNFIASAEYSCRAAEYLKATFENFNPDSLPSALAEIHEIEHAADMKKHEMSAALAKAFVTPVDREDLDLISHNIDNVTDSLEEILQRLYVNGIKTILPEAIGFVEKLLECCELMTNMLREFENFKKPAKLHEMIIELNHQEEICDGLYLEAILAVRKHCTDVLDIIFWREIYDCMEECADACEHVGDCIETVVMKNT